MIRIDRRRSIMATTTSSSKTSDDLQDVVVDLARTQLAAMTAMVGFWRGWVESADTFTQALSEQLNKISEGGQDSKAVLGEFGDSTRQFLRNLTDLPNVATQRFTSEIEKTKKKTGERNRVAKAKP
jgi:ABC-type transporter Mla subunit MlaD